MRTDNGKVKNIIISVYFVLIVLAVIMATVFSAFSHLTDYIWLSFIVVFIMFISVFLVVKYFEYDSDGVKVVVTNKGLLLSDKFNYRAHEVEFYKEDLVNFKFKNYFIYRCLVLHIKSNNRGFVKERFNVTLVTRRKRKYIGQSLSKMVKNNISNKRVSIND
ncbi:hypothetical protein [uncultured Formosa sp.]|uniref:hypothetical protein n=1 Tax=uncultured Formosa sp. TaxID=255435 RepID=UPI00261DE1F5|nr:hypothetical protein [uncultured Formosa sp.]